MHISNRIAIWFFFSAVFFGPCACAIDSTSNNNPRGHFNESKVTLATPVPSTQIKPPVVQDSFHMEEKVLEPIEVPSEILRLLESGATKIVDACKLNGQIITECYEGGRTDLNGDDLADFVIVARGKMSGANITPFWVFLGSKSGPRLVLETAAHDLIIGTEKSNGLFDIGTVSMTAVDIISNQFRFNGKNYERIKTMREPI